MEFLLAEGRHLAQLRGESQTDDSSMTCRYSMGPRLTEFIRLNSPPLCYQTRFGHALPDTPRPLADTPPQELPMAFYELRQHHVKSGKMAQWLELMKGTIIPFQISKARVITDSYRGAEDEPV